MLKQVQHDDRLRERRKKRIPRHPALPFAMTNWLIISTDFRPPSSDFGLTCQTDYVAQFLRFRATAYCKIALMEV